MINSQVTIISIAAVLLGSCLSTATANGDNVLFEYDNYLGGFEPDTRPVTQCDVNCTRNECVVMGFQRFSEPYCAPLGQLGDPCRPSDEPEDKVLEFPHLTMECKQVRMQFCQCAPGLICGDEAECKPMPTRKPRRNFFIPRTRLRPQK